MPTVSATARSAANGAFQITGLAPGRYVLCTPVPGGDLLDACLWSPRAPIAVNVSAGQNALADVNVLAGARVTVQLADPLLALKRDPLAWRAPAVDVEIRAASGVRLPARLKRRIDGLSEYEILVPLGTGHRLFVGSTDVLLRNPLGATIARIGGQDSFDLTSPLPRQFTYQVLGLR